MTIRPAGLLGPAGQVIRRLPAGALRRRFGEPAILLGLLAVTLVLGGAMLRWSSTVPTSALVVPLLFGGLFLSPRPLNWLVAVVALCLIAAGVSDTMGKTFPAVAAVVVITAVVSLLLARSRARLGVKGTTGESMLVDLRDRLTAQGKVPVLPRGWGIEFVHRSAESSGFSGDFLAATLSADGAVLEVALVDVSGKGHGAGTRALLLSGAFGGLLGSVPPGQFLAVANAYLLRQNWPEGFATAVHIALELGSGEYEIRSAGHPPAIHFHAGTGRWVTLDTEGGLLGVFEQTVYQPVAGRLRPGDALMLYTDGLVETPRRDQADGIDKLQGEAERWVARGFRDGARKLVDAVASSDADDRALLLLWRT